MLKPLTSSYVYKEARRIYTELAKHVRKTPLEASRVLGKTANVYLKLGKLTLTYKSQLIHS